MELIILGRRDELINTFQVWRENKLSESSREEGLKHKLRAVLFALYIELEQPLNRKLLVKTGDDPVDSGVADEFKRICTTDVRSEFVSDDDLIKAFLILNKALDELGLIKIDRTKGYKSLEDLNKMKGFD